MSKASLFGSVLTAVVILAGVASAVDVEGIVRGLTLRQKIGQMQQLTTEAIMVDANSNRIAINKLVEFIQQFGVGSLYNTPFMNSRSGTLGWKCTEWIEAVRAIQTKSMEVTGIPILIGLDSLHGANYILGATIFPHNIGAAATWDPELVELSHIITAKDSRTCGIMWNFGPVIDIGLQPLWARHYETFGDEPYLVSVMTRAAVRGMQRPDVSTAQFNYARLGQNTTLCGTTLKHWIGYSMPNSGADRTDATVPDWILQRYFLPAFSGVLAEHPASVMLNSGTMNKVPGHSDKQNIEGLLRTQMKFNGFTLSDYEDVQNLFTKHRVAASLTEATRMAFDSGLDMAMIPWDMTVANELLKVVQAGAISQARIDLSVKRIIEVKDQLGLFENPYGYPDNAGSVGSDEDRAIARRMCEDGITLLKNQNNILPLPAAGAGKKILVTGPTANSLSLQSGGWTWQWQGPLNENQFAGRGTTILQGIQSMGQAKGYAVQYLLGHGLDGPAGNRAAAITEAARSDYIIVCLGEKTYAEMLYNINNLDLGSQSNYVADLKATGKPVILVMVQGRPRLANAAFTAANAILYSYLPGPEGGLAIGRILFGDVNPSGRLPFAYPSATGQLSLFVGQWDHTPLFPLGFGLSYTTFEYSGLTATPKQYSLESSTVVPLVVTVTVKNTGQRNGKEVVRLLLEEPQGPQSQLVFMMKRFTKVSISAGSSVTLSFKLAAQDFRWLLRTSGTNGNVKIRVGTLETSVSFSSTLSPNTYPITTVPDFLPDNMTYAVYPPAWLAPQAELPPADSHPEAPPYSLVSPVAGTAPSSAMAPRSSSTPPPSLGEEPRYFDWPPEHDSEPSNGGVDGPSSSGEPSYVSSYLVNIFLLLLVVCAVLIGPEPHVLSVGL